MNGFGHRGRGLDQTVREPLLDTARILAQRCGEKAGRQAMAALALLRAHGVEGLRRALQQDVQVQLGAATPHWRRFCEVCGPAVVRASERGAEEAAFLLTWVARLSQISNFGHHRLARGSTADR